MTADPVTLAPGQPAIEALRLFDNRGFRHLPICRDGRAIGVVSRYDFRAMEHARLDEETGFFGVLRSAIASGALLTSGRHLQHGDAGQAGRNMELFINCATPPSTNSRMWKCRAAGSRPAR